MYDCSRIPAEDQTCFFFLCSNSGARKSLNCGKPSLRHWSQLPGLDWVELGERPLVDRHIGHFSCTSSDPPGLTFFSSPASVLSPAWTLISFTQVQPYSTPPHTHATCLVAPASSPGDTVPWAYTRATQKCSVNPREMASNGHRLSFLPQNNWPFHKDQTTGYRYQGPT